MEIVRTKTLGSAWKKSFYKVYQQGNIIDDDKGKIKELLDLFVIIQNIEEDSFIKKHGDEQSIKWMKNNFEKKIPIDDWGYCYGQRIYDFLGINQLKSTVERLKKNPYSKSATISLMMAHKDKEHVPCLVALDFKIRKCKLITTVFLRSQDIGKKFYADALAIKNIANKISKEIPSPLGEFVFFIKSAHFYISDLERLEKIFKP